MVDLLRSYSNLSPLPKPLTTDIRPQNESRQTRTRRRPGRIDSKTLAKLLADYKTGTSAERLTKRYGLSKGTVLRLLAQHGVLKTQHRLSAEQKQAAADLYQHGMSLAEVSNHLGFRPEAVRRALDESGIPRRDRYGNQR